MRRILVADYLKTQQCYILDPDTGAVEGQGSEASVSQRPAGYARYVKLGLLKRKHVLAAIYADRERLWLLVGSDRFDLTDPDVRVRRSTVAPLVRRFVATLAGREVLSTAYWMPVRDSMTGPDYDDFLRFVEETARDRTSIRRATECWARRSAERDVAGGTPPSGPGWPTKDDPP